MCQVISFISIPLLLKNVEIKPLERVCYFKCNYLIFNAVIKRTLHYKSEIYIITNMNFRIHALEGATLASAYPCMSPICNGFDKIFEA